MRRRKLLASAGLTSASVLAGCFGAETGTRHECDPPEYPDYGDDYPRIDDPPHDVSLSNDRDEWNPDDLGECMATESDLEYTVHPPRFTGKIEFTYDTTYRATLITDEAARDEHLEFDAMDDDLRDRIAALDFDESFLVAVESGWSLGPHRWARVETIDDGIHLHGYHELPTHHTLELRTEASLLEVERPDAVDRARVSLTGRGLDRDVRRVTFDSTEGLVKLAGGSEPETYSVEPTRIDEALPKSVDHCRFAELSGAVRSEVESAIENGAYRSSERPALMDSDCYGEFIHYEGDVYMLEVKAS